MDLNIWMRLTSCVLWEIYSCLSGSIMLGSAPGNLHTPPGSVTAGLMRLKLSLWGRQTVGLNPTSPGKAVVREQTSFPIKGKEMVPLSAEELFSASTPIYLWCPKPGQLPTTEPFSAALVASSRSQLQQKWRSPRDTPHDAVRCREHLFPTRHAPLQQPGLRIPFQRLREEQNDWETLQTASLL